MVKSAGGWAVCSARRRSGTARHADVGQDGRKVAKGALMVGGTAAVGALAWKFYQKWSGQRRGPTGATRRTGPVSPARTERWPAELQQTPPRLFRGSDGPVAAGGDGFAARADGHIDDKERANIHNAVESLFPPIWRRFWIRC
ncbi:MAG: hypothetical protein ACLRWP_13565 [Bilophila wadsworthia]